MSIIKRILRPLWRLALPVRRVLTGRVDQHLDHHIQVWIDRTMPLQLEQRRATDEMQLLATGLVRELVRLQEQIDGLQETLVKQSAADSGPRTIDYPEAA